MTRRYLLVASSAASVGYVVGWLAGSNVVKLAEGRRLGRPGVPVRPVEARSPVPAPRKPLEAGNGAEEGVWRCGLLDPIGRNRCSLPRDHEGLRRNPDAHDVPWPTPTRWVDLFGALAPDPLPAQRDGAPCPVTLGPLTCPFTGPHTTHAFQSATWAPDRKDDADERIE